MSSKTKIIAGIISVVCSGLIIAGVYFYVKEEAFLKECRLISCRIIDITENIRGKALLTFKEVNGNTKPFIIVESYDPGEDELEYKVGEIYEIYYYSKDVNKSELWDFFGNHSTSMILIFIAVSFLIDIPIFIFASSLRNKVKLQKEQLSLKDQVISE